MPVARERTSMIGASRHGRHAALLRAGVATAGAVSLALLALVASGAVRSRASLLGAQMLVVGEAYPYVRTPYSDVARPYGYQAPAQYPVYPYENGYSYSNVEPYYEAYHKGSGKVEHDWFPDEYNVGTGPLSPLWAAMGMKQPRAQQASLRQVSGAGLASVMSPLETIATSQLSAADGCVCTGSDDEDKGPKCKCVGDPGFPAVDGVFSPSEVTRWGGNEVFDQSQFKGAALQNLRESPSANQQRSIMQSLGRVDYSPTHEVLGGQYYSPVLPTENETPQWTIFGDNWHDHTYEPMVDQARRPEHGATRLQSQGVGARLGDRRGFQQLAHADWETKGHSNNYMGMRAPVRNNNPLGDHQVGFSDARYPARREVNGTEVDVADAEAGNKVVDNTLRYMWDVFAGNQDVTQMAAPKMGYSLDTHVRCAEEDDPALCDMHPAVGRPVSTMHTNPKWIPYPTNARLKQGVLAREGYGQDGGVLPAGGGRRTFKGRRGDLIKDCTDPASCHHFRSRIREGYAPRTVDMKPVWSPPPPPLFNMTTSEPEPEWVDDLRHLSGYKGP